MLMKNIPKRLSRLVALLWFLGAISAAAELTVIFDNGQARPLSDFVGVLDSVQPDKAPSYSEKPQLGAADLESLLPIRSAGLTPGKISARAHPVPFARAFFLIGSDAFSKRWLKNHRTALKQMGAVGMLVEASSIEDLRAIAELADGLPIIPASGSDIAKTLGIRHYPVGCSDRLLLEDGFDLFPDD